MSNNQNICHYTPITTHIARIQSNQYELIYQYNKPLSNYTLNDCPDSLFNYNSPFYINIVSMKNRYNQRIKDINKKLIAFDTHLMNQYINSRFEDLKTNYLEILTKDIESIKDIKSNKPTIDENEQNSSDIFNPNSISFRLSYEKELSEKTSLIKNIDELIYNILFNQWFELHSTTPDSEVKLNESLDKWSKGLLDLDKTYQQWKSDVFSLAQTIENEIISEFNDIPHNCFEFNDRITKHITKLNQYHKTDIINSCIDIVTTKLTSQTYEKYGKSINTLIINAPKNKCTNLIQTTLSTIFNVITSNIARLKVNKFVVATDWYQLKKDITPIIDNIYITFMNKLFMIINDKFKYIPSFTEDITTKDEFKVQSKLLVASFNETNEMITILINSIQTDPLIDDFSDLIDEINASYVDQ